MLVDVRFELNSCFRYSSWVFTFVIGQAFHVVYLNCNFPSTSTELPKPQCASVFISHTLAHWGTSKHGMGFAHTQDLTQLHLLFPSRSRVDSALNFQSRLILPLCCLSHSDASFLTALPFAQRSVLCEPWLVHFGIIHALLWKTWVLPWLFVLWKQSECTIGVGCCSLIYHVKWTTLFELVVASSIFADLR